MKGGCAALDLVKQRRRFREIFLKKKVLDASHFVQTAIEVFELRLSRNHSKTRSWFNMKFIFISSHCMRLLLFVMGCSLSACSSLPGGAVTPETTSQTAFPADPERAREVERLLEGEFSSVKAPSSAACRGSTKLLFEKGRVELMESVKFSSDCQSELRGEIIYYGRIAVGPISEADAVSRPLQIVVEAVELRARMPGWGLPVSAPADPCFFRRLDRGEIRVVTGQNCGAWGRFPAAGAVIDSQIVINSGQRIQIKNWPAPLDGLGGRRQPAHAERDLEFERTTL